MRMIQLTDNNSFDINPFRIVAEQKDKFSCQNKSQRFKLYSSKKKNGFLKAKSIIFLNRLVVGFCFLLLNAAPEPCPRDVTLYAVEF